MSYYAEAQGGGLRAALESELLKWPQVTLRWMYGCPTYMASGHLFAFLVNEGVVFTQLHKADREALAARYTTEPFMVGEREMSQWIKVHLPNLTSLDLMLYYLRRSYELALGKLPSPSAQL